MINGKCRPVELTAMFLLSSVRCITAPSMEAIMELRYLENRALVGEGGLSGTSYLSDQRKRSPRLRHFKQKEAL